MFFWSFPNFYKKSLATFASTLDQKAMFLGVDIGNTRTKIAVYEKDNILEVVFSPTEKFHEKIFEIAQKNPSLDEIVLASVGFLKEEQVEILSKKFKLYRISHNDKFPFINKYGTPSTLGIDRMVLAAGAQLMHPNENVLVIDVGTCITYDFISKESEYLGGAISPGFDLRFKSLNDYTAKLPRLQLEGEAPLIGSSTTTSIQSGVVNGLIAEIDGIIDLYREKNNTLTIILTGGDAKFLSMQLKNSIFVHSFFLLESLNRLYHYIQKYD